MATRVPIRILPFWPEFDRHEHVVMILTAVRIYRHAEPLETLQSEEIVFGIKRTGSE